MNLQGNDLHAYLIANVVGGGSGAMRSPTRFLPLALCGHLEYVGGADNRVLIRSGLHTGITWYPHHTSGGIETAIGHVKNTTST
jgi:hypothetical protein